MEKINQREMKEADKIKYLRLALRMQGHDLCEALAKQFVYTYDMLLKKGGDMDLKDIVDIEIKVKNERSR